MPFRLSRPVVLLLAAGTLALAGCGGSDNEDAAQATTPSAVTDAPTQTAPATGTTPTDATPPTATDAAPATTNPDAPSGGATPPTGTETTPAAKPQAGGVRPTITVRDDGSARAVASDNALAELWCDAARQGAYDDQLQGATSFVIAVRGSDHVESCDLPR